MLGEHCCYCRDRRHLLHEEPKKEEVYAHEIQELARAQTRINNELGRAKFEMELKAI